jgi:hypothetical protein
MTVTAVETVMRDQFADVALSTLFPDTESQIRISNGPPLMLRPMQGGIPNTLVHQITKRGNFAAIRGNLISFSYKDFSTGVNLHDS